jgi:hypothetical protein
MAWHDLESTKVRGHIPLATATTHELGDKRNNRVENRL